MKLYISPFTDPYINLAAEQQLFRTETEALYLWQNRNCIIAGRNQNLYIEADMQYAKFEDILPVRRLTGGGTVYHDLGNLNYSFITKEEDVEKMRYTVIQVLQRNGISAVYSGRNDLLVCGRKCGGTAWLYDEGKVLYHGTLLVNTNLEQMKRVLTPAKLKLRSKAIPSTRSRVINLSEINSDISVNKLIQSFEDYFQCTCIPICLDEQIRKDAESLSDREWIFGECPSYEAVHEVKIDDGIIQVCLSISDGRIADIQVYHDLMDTDSTMNLAVLKGVVYNPASICDKIIGIVKRDREDV